MSDLATALRATVAELERLRYAQEVCPSCGAYIHRVGCRLVAALDMAREALA